MLLPIFMEKHQPMDYIKLFNSHDEYEEYISGSSKTLPNISYCIDANDVHYNENSSENVSS